MDANRVELVEEVPGVPPDERWFIRLNGVTRHFPTEEAGRSWAAERAINIDAVEYFEP